MTDKKYPMNEVSAQLDDCECNEHECRYKLASSLSALTRVCFSCRKGLHYGAKPV